MKSAKIRLIIAVAVFVIWLGYLGYLALAVPRAIVVSRSQLLLANQIVRAEISLDEAGKPNKVVRVVELISGPPIPSETITIENLSEARSAGNKPLSNPGHYLLLLDRRDLRTCRLVSAPSGTGQDSSRPLLVYPWNDAVERQIRDELTGAK